jgi:hypothetical protein
MTHARGSRLIIGKEQPRPQAPDAETSASVSSRDTLGANKKRH